MHQVAAGFFVQLPREASNGQKPPEAFTNSKHYRVPELSLHTESVSGFRAVSAVSAAPRFARNQCYLKSLALGARSSSFAIPKFREEPNFLSNYLARRSLGRDREP